MPAPADIKQDEIVCAAVSPIARRVLLRNAATANPFAYFRAGAGVDLASGDTSYTASSSSDVMGLASDDDGEAVAEHAAADEPAGMLNCVLKTHALLQ